MKTKRVNRYYCDYCKKSGCSAGHMRRHEERCTMNPERTCRVCKLVEAEQKPMAELLAVLPVRQQFPDLEDEDGCTVISEAFVSAVNDALPVLRDVAENCPACVLAALRQAGAYLPAVSGFNFTEEMKAVWREVNQSQAEADY